MISTLGSVQYSDNIATTALTYFGLSTDTPKPTVGVGCGIPECVYSVCLSVSVPQRPAHLL